MKRRPNEKAQRNIEIHKRWKKTKLGYKKLGDFYNLHKSTVQNIIQREEQRVGSYPQSPIAMGR